MTRSGIKCSKELILSQYFCFGERIEEGSLSGIGIADYGYDRNDLGCALPTMLFTLLAYPLYLLTQLGNTAANTPAINLQFCFTRATHTNGAANAASASTPRAACLPRKFYTSPGQAGPAILQLRQFDLQTPLPGATVRREDIQDQAFTPHYTPIHPLFPLPLLCRTIPVL